MKYANGSLIVNGKQENLNDMFLNFLKSLSDRVSNLERTTQSIVTTTIYAHLCPDQAIKELRDKFGKRNAHQGQDAVGGGK